MIMGAILTLVACSKEEKATVEKSGSLSDLVSDGKDYSKVNNAMQGINNNIETLKKLQPRTNQELKTVLPKQLLGLKRKEISAGDNAMLNLSTAEAKYTEGENKNIKLEIIDGAGETGSTMVSIMMMGLNADQEKITETGFEKSKEINGVKSTVSEDKKVDHVISKIQTVLKNRYLVTLTADGFSSDELQKALDEINISALK